MSKELPSAIRDNQGRGKVGDFLKDKILNGSKLSIVSAYFTIYAFEGRGGKLPPQSQQVKGADDFELITWLIIKGEESA